MIKKQRFTCPKRRGESKIVVPKEIAKESFELEALTVEDIQMMVESVKYGLSIVLCCISLSLVLFQELVEAINAHNGTTICLSNLETLL